MSASLNARGAPPPLALARRLRAALRPQALLNARGALRLSLRLGPHPQALPLALRAHGGSWLSLALALRRCSGRPRACRGVARRLRAALGPQALLTLLLLMPAEARAEYKRIELKIFGMDCAICAHGVRVAIQKVDGVESVELSLERAEADVRLRQDNRASLDRFRQIVKANGFEPRHATVTAVGTVREVGGKLAFEVSGVTTVLIVDSDKSAPSAYKQLKSALDSKKPAVFEVVGTVERNVEKSSAGVESIVIASVK